MKRELGFIHKDFRLDGRTFEGAGDLLEYTDRHHPSHSAFLRSFFNENEDILIRTSGSTGKPKQIKISKQSMVQSARATIDYFQLPPKTRALICLSSDFIAGKLMWIRALTGGWNISVTSPEGNTLDRVIGDFDFSAMIPLQVENALHDIFRIRLLLIGGAPVSQALEKKLAPTGTQIYHTYGMTETLTHIAVRKIPGEDTYKLLPHVRAYTDDRGCLVIEANHLPEPVITNDVVEFTSNKRFRWLGRYDFMINSGGIKFFPQDIEKKLEAYLTRPFFIHSLPDERLGQKIALVIQGEKAIPEDQMQEIFHRAGLKKYEKPKQIIYTPAFHKTPGGKIDKLTTLADYYKK